MYQYIWDEETGGLLLINEQSKFSKEPRPVFYEELDILGFNQFWDYPKDETNPIMWAESSNYIYKGRVVAKTKGGSCYTKPEIILVDQPEVSGCQLTPVNVEKMIEKNQDFLETMVQETIQHTYNTYRKYKKNVDVFYVAFSGGKDSVVVFDIVQRALPHNDFVVIFGNTRMEFPDTYQVVREIKEKCKDLNISFYQAESKLLPHDTWNCFGPPSTANRWCCSVHKTSPQINLLREITGKRDFTGMAFTGVRAEESFARSNYESVNDGMKHSGQMSCHAILDWSSAELYLYIFARQLTLNKAYRKGNVRAGCLVCPNSSGKHEYIKRLCYTEEVDFFLNKIRSTSGKVSYSKEDMDEYIDAGFWRTRKSGRELNFGHDKFEVISGSKPPMIDVFQNTINWQKWGKTIGDITQISDEEFRINYANKSYVVNIENKGSKLTFILTNCENSKADIKFQSLFRSVIVKSLYCIGCGECEAECKYNCIDMKNGISVGNNCSHCYKCHDVKEHCLRYASIRNKLMEGKKMAGLDRYYTFGTRDEWIDTFVNYGGSSDFWLSDGDGQVANKKKDAFKNFIEDAGLTVYDKAADGDKYSKNVPTAFAQVIFNLGAYNPISWALMLCNLVYTPAFNWFVKNLHFGEVYTPDALILMLSDVMENDTKGKGKRNVVDALKILLAKTPLGKDRIFAFCDYSEKHASSGKETITLNSLVRESWMEPDSRVVLYSLYKFAENCGEYYQFSLSTLLDDSIERDGVSPTQIFGIDYDSMIPILNGLSVNYPDLISASFALGLDTINLNPDKKSDDIIELFN